VFGVFGFCDVILGHTCVQLFSYIVQLLVCLWWILRCAATCHVYVVICCYCVLRAAYIGALSKHRILLTDLSSTDNSAESSDADLMFYLSIYGGLAAANSLLTLIRAFLFAYGGIEAAVILHSRLLTSVLKVEVCFWRLELWNYVLFVLVCFMNSACWLLV